MAKKQQIIVSQYDSNIVIPIQMLDKDSNPIDLSITNITPYIVYPDNTEKPTKQFETMEALNGELEVTLSQDDTSNEGLHFIFVEFSTSDGRINTTQGVSYFVMARHGGAV